MKNLSEMLTTPTVVAILAISSFSFADVGWAQRERPKKLIKVAVIDTGIDEDLLKKNAYCESGHKDFSGSPYGLKDNHGHGTHISGIIDQYTKDYIFKLGKSANDIDKIQADYCQIIIKFYDPKYASDNLNNTIAAFKYAIEQNVDIINYSAGGNEFSAEEKAVVTEALNKGIKVVAAAGNERSKIELHAYYPAMYDKRIIVVGNLLHEDVYKPVVQYKLKKVKKKLIKQKFIDYKLERDIAATSNYGDSIPYWEVGTNVLSRLPGKNYGFMTGTSQAAAVKTGKIIHEMLSKK